MACFYLLLVLLTVTSGCRADSMLSVSAFLEDSVALPCGHFYKKDLTSGLRMRWIKYSTDTSEKKVILSWPETSQDAKHVKWGSDEKGTMSLILTNSQKSDEGIYICEFCLLWNCTLRNISLRVKDCKVRPAVKVAHSTPFQLNCSVDIKGQKGPLNVSWVLLKAGEPSPLISERVEVSGTSLVIKSPSISDSSWYRCSYTYGKNHGCYDIRMHVQAEDVEATTFQQAEDVEATTFRQVENVEETIFQQANRTTEQSGDTLTAALSPVITVAVVIAVLAGVYIYWRRSQQTQRDSEGAVREIECIHDYDYPVTLMPSNDLSDSSQEFNRIYHHLENDSLHTCK
ncbi:hypothetical protein JOB18_002075 [Solea senegalensis]|uniref:Immunoglobulin domain-containing protein n=1 Tax=Solea senegalensis TaxID=28829 RepID=A0AAV6PRX3_SOLSE|nr:uncharacterized protein LOC122775241 [Solea senegalensis]KAG7474100.1 hypothetical protein JOB18_002075 [Solea senegalensis]